MRRCILAVLALTLLVLITACEKTYPAGPAGTVTDHHSRYFKSGGWQFSLTVDGHKFRVTRDDYKACADGSRYPACTNR